MLTTFDGNVFFSSFNRLFQIGNFNSPNAKENTDWMREENREKKTSIICKTHTALIYIILMCELMIVDSFKAKQKEKNFYS